MTHTLVSNGTVKRTGGERRVVLSPHGEIREVIKATRIASRDRRCTFQRVLDGDYVIELVWDNASSEYRLHQIMDGGQSVRQPLTESNMAVMSRLVDSMPTTLQHWLRPVYEESESNLPDGCGWTEGLTVSDRRKRRAAEEFFHGLPQSWIDKILPIVQASPHEGLLYNLDKAGAMPAVMDAPKHAHEHKDGMLDIWTEWVLWYQDGTVVNMAPLPTSGLFTSSISGQECEYVYAASPVEIPHTVVRACKITHGPYTRRGGRESYGVKWELYRR